MREIHAASNNPAPAWLRAGPALFVLLWSLGFVFLKLGLAYADPLTFLALRYACVVLLLLLPFLWLRAPMPNGWPAWRHLLVVGLLLQAGYFSFAYLSLKLGMSAGTLALITSQQPILVGLLAPMLAGETVGRVRWAGLVLGVAGASIVILANSITGSGTSWAITFAVMALLTLAGSTLWEKRYGAETHPVTANLVQYTVGLLVTAPLAFWLEPMRISWTPGLLVSLSYLVLGNSIIAISLLLAMIRHGEASRVSALFFMVPPATAILAFIALGETLAWAAWPGIALAVAGIYLVMRR
ncbi:DMT family transporter [Allopusillimonas ginsengisoli]|nr:DMT family transporter [Allopusillimonas ginsengisoli]